MPRFQNALRCGLLLAVLAAMDGHAAGAASSDPMIAIRPLTKYVLPDQTASVMLPDGWHVTQTDVAFIRAEGPDGELAMFGVSVPAHDGAGSGASSPERLSQPYSADPGDKLNQSIQWLRTANHLSPVTVIKIYSNTPFTAPRELGNCSNMTATLSANGAVLDAEADLCSLPVDGAGNYLNLLKIVAISPDQARSERSTMEAVLASYILKTKALQQNQQQAEQSAAGSTRKAATQSHANAITAAAMAPAMRQEQTSDQAIGYFDRTTLSGQIPASIVSQGTFWVDPN